MSQVYERQIKKLFLLKTKRKMRGFVPPHPVELFSLLLALSGKSFPHRAQGEHICGAHSASREIMKSGVSAVCERKAPPRFPSSALPLFNLHFVLKQMYRNKQIINSSLSSILCLACKPLPISSQFPRRTAEGLVIGRGSVFIIQYELQAI